MDLHTIFVNGTSQINIQTEPDFASKVIFILIPIIATSIIGYMTIKYGKKQHERTAMMDVFHLLHESHKNAEEILHGAYRENRLIDIQQIADAYKGYAVIVERNYDQVGVLIREGLIPSNPYYITFGATTVISYRVLYDELKNIRIQGKPFFRAHFHNLAIDWLNYWYDSGSQQIHPITDPRTNQEIPKDFFGEKIPFPKKRKHNLKHS